MSTSETARDSALDHSTDHVDETPFISGVGVQYFEGTDAADGLLSKAGKLVSLVTKGAREVDPQMVKQATQVYNDVLTNYQEAKAQRAELELREQMSTLDGQRQQAELELKQVESDLEIRKQAVEIEMQRVQLSRAARADSVRGTVLLLVVFALVLTPLIAMTPLVTVGPDEFSQYIAPITGIAGTVLGYWFGREERSGK